MKLKLAFLALVLCLSGPAARAKPSTLDLLGKWEGTVDFGKFKFTLQIRIATNSAGRVEVAIDLPEQGQIGVPADALLFNPPDVRLEIDRFGTAYNGKVNSTFTEIDGEFEEGPGGRPERLVFKRSNKPDAPEPEKSYTFAKGEPRDIRGYWKGEMEGGGPMAMKMLAGLNIGRLSDGTFKATMDLPEQGAKNIPASSVTATNKGVILKWNGFDGSFEATLSEDGNQLTGPWMQMGRSNSVTFTRIDGPLKLIPDNVSFTPDTRKSDDIRGYWKGALEIPGRKLRLVVKVGRAPDGNYAATMASLDQGGQELPASTASFTAPTLKIEWKGIRGKYEGTISKDGNSIEGKWEQMGAPMPLKLERTTEKESKS
jgi:hypothetical protein